MGRMKELWIDAMNADADAACEYSTEEYELKEERNQEIIEECEQGIKLAEEEIMEDIKSNFKMNKAEKENCVLLEGGRWSYCKRSKTLFIDYDGYSRCKYTDCKFQSKLINDTAYVFISGNDWFSRWCFILKVDDGFIIPKIIK